MSENKDQEHIYLISRDPSFIKNIFYLLYIPSVGYKKCKINEEIRSWKSYSKISSSLAVFY